MLRRTAALASIAFAASILVPTDSAATAQRTFVASYGLTANTAFNCSIAKPCRAFSDAIGVTNSGGEVIVLDSAGYGPVTISQSVSIIAPAGVYAGITVFSGNGLTINGSNIDVTLRNLTVNGQGGDYGIVFTAGRSLIVDRCTISSMSSAGIYLDTVAAANATLSHVKLERNGNGLGIGSNIEASISDSQISDSSISAIQDIPATGGGTLHVDRTVMDHNNHGVTVSTVGASSGVQLIVHLSEDKIVDSGTDGIFANGGAGTLLLVYVSDCRITNNAGAGIHAFNFLSPIVLANNVINANGAGGVLGASFVYTMQNNVVRDNFVGNIIGGLLGPLGFN